MSEKKKEKVIYVKDLVIKADNVIIQPENHRKDDHKKEQHRGWDPFFGGRRGSQDESKDGSQHKHKKHDDESSSSRGGFSWI
ncbi:hypothetical protein [Halobacillus massiliensis]|uniref:hypothetical protein n=1 Tax=Halobacillus massiliensis TaxID=1926286 RepID=UPI0009E46392|nr:hypothetical protein [Halobacillus massiliensis]